MKAMLLAAGLASRMGAQGQEQPKCLLEVAGRTLIEYHLYALAEAGIEEVIINVAHWADLLQRTLGDGSHYRLRISYSIEAEPLGTGGGIRQALPLLGMGPFVVINSDIWTDYPYQQLLHEPDHLAHLIMVDNLPGEGGDFALEDDRLLLDGQRWLTYAGLGIFRPELFLQAQAGHFGLREYLLTGIEKGLVRAEYYAGQWYNVNTPANLEALRERVEKR